MSGPQWRFIDAEARTEEKLCAHHPLAFSRNQDPRQPKLDRPLSAAEETSCLRQSERLMARGSMSASERSGRHRWPTRWPRAGRRRAVSARPSAAQAGRRSAGTAAASRGATSSVPAPRVSRRASTGALASGPRASRSPARSQPSRASQSRRAMAGALSVEECEIKIRDTDNTPLMMTD
jgi:hypothetical protein